jgi:Rieske 2Fe-2S family protein
MAPAPLDLDAVKESLVGNGRMLPAAAYTAEAMLEWERRVLFTSGWL